MTIDWAGRRVTLVIGSGTATLLTAESRFVLVKPSIIYAIVGAAMLRRGWMNRYLPPIRLAIIPDIAVIVGYCWAALMFATAGAQPRRRPELQHGVLDGVHGNFHHSGSKIALFLASYFAMRMIGLRRRNTGVVSAQGSSRVRTTALYKLDFRLRENDKVLDKPS